MASNNIGTLLRRNPGLQRLQTHAAKLQRLESLLNERLPEQIRSHCRVAALTDGVLTLHTDSPAWAAKLRYMTRDMLSIVQDCQLGEPVNTITVKARPPTSDSQHHETGHHPESGPHLSAQSAKFLRDTAATLEDPELRAALFRLSDQS